MKIQEAVDIARACLGDGEYMVAPVPREVVKELIDAARYHPSIRYVPCSEGNTKIHTLAGGQKVIVRERERG
jgi:hypothetical protein